MPHPDQVYISALLNNDAEKIEEIYRLFSGKICAFVVSNSGSESEAKDIFQESLISIYSQAKDKEFELTCPFEAFLFMVCKRKWYNVLKSGRKKTETNLSSDVSHNAFADELSARTIEKEKRMKLLEQKLRSLGESCQKILNLSWKGMHMEKVAEACDVSYAYVRKKKSECIARLTKLIKEDPQFSELKYI
ncbi:MAG: sigma-70 family RNA polymerase sigma factor [Bacteroidota bacterium]